MPDACAAKHDLSRMSLPDAIRAIAAPRSRRWLRATAACGGGGIIMPKHPITPNPYAPFANAKERDCFVPIADTIVRLWETRLAAGDAPADLRAQLVDLVAAGIKAHRHWGPR